MPLFVSNLASIPSSALLTSLALSFNAFTSPLVKLNIIADLFSDTALCQSFTITSLAFATSSNACTISLFLYSPIASPISPSANNFVASICQLSFCLLMSFNSTCPTLSIIPLNAPPASIACNCCGSPISTTFASANVTSSIIFDKSLLPNIPASSTTTMSFFCNLSLSLFQLTILFATV